MAPVLVAPSWLCRVSVDCDDGGADSSAQQLGGSGGAPVEETPRGKKKRKLAAAAAEATPAATTPETATASGGPGGSSHVVRAYGGILTFGFLAPGEALVVEQPWLRVMDHFPPALYRHRFGT